MNVNPLLLQAYDVFGVPIYPNTFMGKEGATPPDDYLVFNYSDERPILRADGRDWNDKTTIQLHNFLKDDPQPRKRQLRKFLHDRGFVIINTGELYESDRKYYHIVIEATIEGAINDD